MFEEVPRTRRGLAGLAARHIVLGPVLIGGMVLAAVGGSVAVAATVITASSTRSDVPPPVRHRAAVASSTAHRPASGHHRPATTSPSSTYPVAAPANPTRPTSQPPPRSASSEPASSEPASTAPASSGSRQASPSPSPSGPAGNALIHVSGFSDQRVRFQFAVVSYGSGPGGSDVYQVSSGREYSATLADDLTITSAGQLCPPAGSSCSTDQLIAAAGTGFFAIAAIDPADQLHSIIEVDNVESSFAPVLTPSPSPTGP